MADDTRAEELLARTDNAAVATLEKLTEATESSKRDYLPLPHTGWVTVANVITGHNPGSATGRQNGSSLV